MTARRLTAVAVLLLATGWSLTATAYNIIRTSNGAEVHWASGAMPVGWYLDDDGCDDLVMEDLETAYQHSFAVWDAIPCAQAGVAYLGRIDKTRGDCGVIPPDGKNVMIFVEEDWPSEWTGALGITQPVFNPTNGQISDADIFYNGAHFTWSAQEGSASNRVDIWNVGAHENGHFFGLDHPGESGLPGDDEHPEATMYYASSVGEISRRYPALDDIQGLCHLYPVQGANGSPCILNGNCNSGLCKADPDTATLFCTNACQTDDDCGEAFACNAEQGFCVARGGRLAGFGDSCTDGIPCKDDLYCVANAAADLSMCSRDCPPECPEGYLCQSFSGGKHACWMKNTWGGRLGESCSAAEPCHSDYDCTTVSGKGTMCTRTCPPECPPDFTCMALVGASSVCWTTQNTEAGVGQECIWNRSCAGDLCVTVAGVDTMRCSQECSTGADCPDGFMCLAATSNGNPVQACWPASVTEGKTKVISFTASPASPAPMGSVTVTCQAAAPNGILYQLWYVGLDGAYRELSPWSESGQATTLLSVEGLHGFVCRVRDIYSGEHFDDVAYLDYVIDNDIVLADGDQESIDTLSDTDTDRGAAANGGGGCAGAPPSWLVLLAGLMLLTRRRTRVIAPRY